MSDNRKDVRQDAETFLRKNKSIVDVSDSENSVSIDNRSAVLWYIKLPTWTDSVYVAGIKLLVLVFGCVFLWQIARKNDGIIKLIEIMIEHGKVGYLAIVTAFYFLAKSILLSVNQNISNKP